MCLVHQSSNSTPCFSHRLVALCSAAQRGKSYSGVVNCASTLLREEGPLAFYRGSSVFFLRTIPIFTLYFPIYERVRLLLGMGYLN